MKHALLFLLHVVLAVWSYGQSPQDKAKAIAPAPATAPAPPAGLTISDPMYPLPPDLRMKVRDQQIVYDGLEIENQKMLVAIEQNKQRQDAAMAQIKIIAGEFAKEKNINLDAYDLDGKEVRFVKRKSQSPQQTN